MELQKIQQMIYEVRGIKVMLDKDIAALYQVTTGNLNKAVKRNIKRFPPDFMFQLTKEEWDSLRFQIGILDVGRGKYTKYLPYAFTEQGLAMLSGILNSEIAIYTNISIMRAFVAIRQNLPIISTQKELEELKQRIKALEESDIETHNAIKETKEELIRVYQALTELGEIEKEPIPEIGFAAIEKRRNK